MNYEILEQPPLRILITEPIAVAGIEQLRKVAMVDQRFELRPADLVSAIPPYNALIVRGATRVKAEVINAGQRLRVIGRAGSGVDNIDVVAATACNIAVVNAPDANTIAVAELTISLILALARNVPQAAASLASGAWMRGAFMGTELHGKTLGLIGLGRIGSAVAVRAQAFGLVVLAHDPWVTPQHAAELGVKAVPLKELLSQSDYVSLHVPLNTATRGLLSGPQLKHLKPGARLINTARGELIDEADLLMLLDSGECAGAALDVFTREPPHGNPLLGHPRVLATPHLGAATIEAQERASLEVVARVLAILQSSRPRSMRADA